MVDATAHLDATRGGWVGGGGMITFMELANMVDACYVSCVAVALAHMVDATAHLDATRGGWVGGGVGMITFMEHSWLRETNGQ